MSRTRLFLLTLLSMVAFAGNSLLCRLALTETGIDAASFTSLRLISGALCLGTIVRLRGGGMSGPAGSWASGMALFLYAAGFSFAYLTLPAGTGALLLFGAVQATMIGWGIRAGERLNLRRTAGLVCAFGGLVILLLPGLSAPPLGGTLLMLAAGIAWGVYSLRGTGSDDAVRTTAGNFLRAVPFAAGLNVALLSRASLDGRGIGYALASGAVASGLGYAVWYTALKGLKTTSAATVQLSVPVLAAVGGIVFLSEQLTARLLLSAVAILGGIALVMCNRRQS